MFHFSVYYVVMKAIAIVLSLQFSLSPTNAMTQINTFKILNKKQNNSQMLINCKWSLQGIANIAGTETRQNSFAFAVMPKIC